MSEIEAIQELMDGISPGIWDWTSHKREDGKPIESVDDVAAIMALSARKGKGLELHGVGAKQGGEDIVVCYTGNGPRSANNARFLANAPSAIDWLMGEVARLTQALAAKGAELAMAFRVVDSHKEREKNAVRIGCENITRAEKAESQLALAMGVVEAARSIDDYEPLGLALAAFDQARGGEEED